MFIIFVLYKVLLMNVVADKKFEQILKEEAKDFSIDWSLVEIKWVLYEELLLTHLKPPLGKNMVKMVDFRIQRKNFSAGCRQLVPFLPFHILYLLQNRRYSN